MLDYLAEKLRPFARHEVVIYDYVDRHVPVLATLFAGWSRCSRPAYCTRMFEKRLRGYRALGYALPSDA